MTLEELRKAIDAIPERQLYITIEDSMRRLRARDEAWKAAFDWYVAMDERCATGPGSLCDLEKEHEEGMRLIREKLK